MRCTWLSRSGGGRGGGGGGGGAGGGGRRRKKQSTEFAQLSVWPLQFWRQAVPDTAAGSGETPVAKTGAGPRDNVCVHVGRMQTAAIFVRGSQNAIVSKVRRRQAVQRLIN